MAGRGPLKANRKRSAVLASALATVLAAEAQQPAQKVDKVEVTGTRIPPPNLESSSPIAVIGAGDIRKEGTLPLELILSNLPQVVADQGGMLSNGATGTATVDLRGLGSNRTLVLVNGRRLPAGTPNLVGADLNQIPSSLIRRVDVYTGGASAVYGSDAIAGVVNFIMNDRFEGVQGEVTHSFYNHQQQNPRGVADIIAQRATTNPAQYKVPGDVSADGQSTVVNLTLGGNFAAGKGNATVFFGYRDEQAILGSTRDFSACALESSAGGFACGGSPTSYPGRFIETSNFTSWTPADASGSVRRWLPATDRFNFAPTNYYRRPDQRYNFNGFAGYEVTPDARVYSEFGFHDDHSVAQIAESGLFGVTAPIAFENPLLSSDWRARLGLHKPDDSTDVIVQRRNVEGGGRQADLRHTSFREVLGVRGTVAGHWDYDAYYQTAKVIYQQVYRNDFSISRGMRALDVVTDPASGRPVCRSVLDGSDPYCVPYDIWRLGAVTPAALEYLQTPGFQKGHTGQDVLGATVATDLGNYAISLPGGGVEIALGFERRREELTRQADSTFSSGDLAGQGSAQPSLSGGYAVKEAFAELRVPVLETLRANGSYRYSSYDTGKRTNTYGAGFDFEPVREARLRGSFQRAIRAANIAELFEPQVVSGAELTDPCEGSRPQRSLADCARTGVTAQQYGAIPVYPLLFPSTETLEGGNLALEPETARTATLGLVVTPMRNLSLAADYWQIALEDAISTAGAETTFVLCLDTGDPLYCNRVHRNAPSGAMWLPGSRVDDTLINVSKWRTSGVDVTLSFSGRIEGGGSLAIDGLGTYVREFVAESYPGSGEYDCAGLYGDACRRPMPKWRHRLRATWNTPWNVELAATWRYSSAVLQAGTSSNPVLAHPVNEVDRQLSAMSYLDLAAMWAIDKRFTLRAGISNVTDRDPPLSGVTGAPSGNGNTYPQIYDALGRRVWLSLAAKF